MDVISHTKHWMTGGYHEPRVQDYFMLNTPTWQVISLLVLYNLIAAKFGPQWAKNRQPYDLRPYMLVLAGLQFGVYGVAIPILAWLTNFGATAWQCADRQDLPFIEEIYLRLGYTYLWLKIADISTTLIMILRKKPSQIPLEHSLRTSSLIFIIFFGLKLYPRGSFIFLPFTDTFMSVARSSYHVLAAPGNAFKHHLWFKRYIYWLALVVGLANCWHMVYHLTNGCAGPLVMLLAVLVHNVGEVLCALGHILGYITENKLTGKLE